MAKTQTVYKFRSMLAIILPTGERFNLELLTETGIPVETKETDETPYHGQPTQYIPKKARAVTSLSTVQITYYENTLAPAQYQLAAAAATNKVLNCFIIHGERDVPFGYNFSAQVKTHTPESHTTDGQKMATDELELTAGIYRGDISALLLAASTAA